MAKKVRKSSYDMRILKLIDKYEKETGREFEITEFAHWAEVHDEFTPSLNDARKKFSRDIAKALSKDIIPDEDGEPVRRRQPFTKQQKTFWKTIEDINPEEMRISAQLTRRRVGGEVFQKQRDLDYYNKNHNPGDPIDVSWDFDKDIHERKQPLDYPEEPPEDEDSDS